MPCGCTSTCGCVVKGGAGIVVTKLGADTFVISAEASVQIGVPTFVQSTPPVYAGGPYVWYQTDADTGEVLTVFTETDGAP